MKQSMRERIVEVLKAPATPKDYNCWHENMADRILAIMREEQNKGEKKMSNSSNSVTKKSNLCSNPHPDLPKNWGKLPPHFGDMKQVDAFLYGQTFYKRLKLLMTDKPHKRTKSRMQKTQYIQRFGNEDFTVTIERGDKLNSLTDVIEKLGEK